MLAAHHSPISTGATSCTRFRPEAGLPSGRSLLCRASLGSNRHLRMDLHASPQVANSRVISPTPIRTGASRCGCELARNPLARTVPERGSCFALAAPSTRLPKSFDLPVNMFQENLFVAALLRRCAGQAPARHFVIKRTCFRQATTGLSRLNLSCTPGCRFLNCLLSTGQGGDRAAVGAARTRLTDDAACVWFSP